MIKTIRLCARVDYIGKGIVLNSTPSAVGEKHPTAAHRIGLFNICQGKSTYLTCLK